MELKDGQPCSHPGRLNHVTHPCEGCGRMAGRALKETAQDERRKRFEATHLGDNAQLARQNEYGDYAISSAQNAWEGWQAAWNRRESSNSEQASEPVAEVVGAASGGREVQTIAVTYPLQKGTELYTTPQPCPRCPKEFYWAKANAKLTDKLAALEAENARLVKHQCNDVCVFHRGVDIQELQTTITQQAGRITELESDLNYATQGQYTQAQIDSAKIVGENISLKLQLAAAEKAHHHLKTDMEIIAAGAFRIPVREFAMHSMAGLDAAIASHKAEGKF